MMKQVYWHSRRSKAHRCLPEARIAGATVEEISSKAPPAVAKSTPTAAKLGCAFSHSAERIVDELGLLYPRKNMASAWRIVGSIRPKKTY